MASADRPLRLIVVGCGDIAEQAHLPAIARAKGVELAGLVDVDPAARTRLAERYRVPAAADPAAALDWAPDAAIVATPPEVTPGLTGQLLRLGLPVLCEKPMAADVEAARALHGLAEASGLVVQVGFVNRFSPVIARVGEWIQSGRLGRPLLFLLSAFDERYDPVDATHLNRIMHFLTHGPAFVHEAAHQTDYVFHLGGGRAVEVTAMGTVSRPEFPADNYTAALVRYDNGDVARLEVGWMFPTMPPGDFRILGPDGAVQVNRAQGWATLTTPEGEERVDLDRPWVEVSFDGQLAAFAAAVRTGRPRGPGTGDGLASVALCMDVAAAARARTGAAA
jgi:predicted dehydrogenase